MDKKPLLIIIGADKGGVGKTTFARVLLDFFQEQNLPFRAIDSEAPEGVLKRFYPEKTEIVYITESSNQMMVFDKLTPSVATIIDVRAGLLTPTLKTMINIGLLDMVTDGEINLVIFHVLGPTLASLKEIDETSKLISKSYHFLVKNHINQTKFFEWNKEAYDAAFGNIRSGIIDIPNLDELATEHVEASGKTYSDFIKSTDNSLTLRGYVRNWRKECQKELLKDPLIMDIFRSGTN